VSSRLTVTFRLVGSVAANVAIFGALLFVPAGTLHWWRAWLFLGVVLIATSATMFGVFAANEELLSERYKSPLQESQPLADKIALTAFVASFVVAIVLIPLDVFRLHVADAPNIFVSCLGLLAFILGWCLISFAFRENAFAAPVVKLQEERHQRVIETGVYAWVRHPMYASVPLLLVGMALWLGSYAAAAFAIVPIIAIAIRIVFEERFLRDALPGYDSYIRRVRYRMIPFVW
jgi:protein-S-isoprenylcysteine O-methyltransferase Ste14